MKTYGAASAAPFFGTFFAGNLSRKVPDDLESVGKGVFSLLLEISIGEGAGIKIIRRGCVSRETWVPKKNRRFCFT